MSSNSVEKRRLTILNKKLMKENRQLKYRLKLGEEKLKQITQKRKATIQKKPANQFKELPDYTEDYQPRKQKQSQIDRRNLNGKRYFVSGEIKYKIRWMTQNADGAVEYSKWYERDAKESFVFLATDEKEARYQFKRKAYEIYEEVDELPSSGAERRIILITYTSVKRAHHRNRLPTTEMPLKSMQPLQYDFVKEFKEYQKNDGFCVIDNIVGMYGKQIPALNTRDKVIDIIRDNEDDNGLDAGIIGRSKDDGTYWSIEDGITPNQINDYICKRYDISHYGFDITNNLFIHNKSRNQNYPALCYYAINNHQYLVRDPEVIQTLV